MTPQFIKLSACRKLAMDLADRRFPGKFTRFATPDWVAELDDLVRNHITRVVTNMPSVGKTVYPSRRLNKETQ